MRDMTNPFAALVSQGTDVLLTLLAMHRADRRPDKIDLGVGVYRDENGQTPVLRAVKAAEARLVSEQTTKAYLGAEGDIRFTERLAEVVFGPSAHNPRRFGIQTPGGTGALRLGAELLTLGAPDSCIWMGSPTWPNHAPIFEDAGLLTMPHVYIDPVSGDIVLDEMLGALAGARPGDIVLLHGCCHNPTGTHFTLEAWRKLASFCNARGLVPFIDLAYQGLGDGLEEDVAGMRLLLAAVPNAFVAYSCDKNFGLYRERVGALWVQTSSPELTDLVKANIVAVARGLWSMPPDHGAAIVRVILDDPALAKDWRNELAEMRTRLNAMRMALAAMHPVLAPIAEQRGLFSILPIDPDTVADLRASHGIYMVDSGRINIAGLNPGNLARFGEALLPHLAAFPSRQALSDTVLSYPLPAREAAS